MERKSKRSPRNYARFKNSQIDDGMPLSFGRWLSQSIVAGVILAVLLFILVNFYVFSSIVSLDSFLVVFLVLTILTDGIFLALQLLRRPVRHKRLVCDPDKVSAVIACYNGADVLGETIEHLKRQLKPENIIVVSDASTDNTAAIARSLGVRVVENKKNLNKAFSVGVGAHMATTPYVIVLDDDVLIGNAIIPTNLMDQGYAAVAFSVMPIKTDTLVNALEQFEYRSSMHVGKNLRATTDSIGNISGAIGLYRTEDLQEQAYLHSGQFAGEDEQRTLLAHIFSSGKGITYSGETVYTHVPNTFHALYRQRAYSWSLSVPELLVLYFRIILSPRYHYLLKAEKSYYTYIYLTDPLRVLFLWALFLRPRYLFMTYSVYLLMNSLVWLKTGRKDQYLMVLLSPVYTLWLSLCRFIGNFYWIKVKLTYFAKRHHKLVERRRIVAEFAVVIILFSSAWLVSTYHFVDEMRLFNKIRSSRLEETAQAFNYDADTSQPVAGMNNLDLQFTSTAPLNGTYVAVSIEKGDTLRSIAHRAVDRFANSRVDIIVPYDRRAAVDHAVAENMKRGGIYFERATGNLLVENTVIEQALQASDGETQ